MSEQVRRYGKDLRYSGYGQYELVGICESESGDYVLHSDHLGALEAARAADKAEIERLRDLVYVPGQWRCAKCSLTITRTVLSVPAGTMHADDESAPCPNGCGPLWRVSERDERKEAQRSFCDQFDELAVAKARIADLEVKVQQADSLVNDSEAMRKDAERWREIERRFENASTIYCERALQYLGLPSRQKNMLNLGATVDAAIAAAKEGK